MQEPTSCTSVRRLLRPLRPIRRLQLLLPSLTSSGWTDSTGSSSSLRRESERAVSSSGRRLPVFREHGPTGPWQPSPRHTGQLHAVASSQGTSPAAPAHRTSSSCPSVSEEALPQYGTWLSATTEELRGN